MRKKRIRKVIGICMVALIFLSIPNTMTITNANTIILDKKIIERTTPAGIDYDDLPTAIDDFIEERKEGCASVSVEVFKEDETLYKKQYGYSDVKNKVGVNNDTVYEWGSVSKMLVWTSVMQLYEENKLDLNADIREYLPEGFLTKLSFDKPITMINLMNHNAGWQEVTKDIEVTDSTDIVDLESALKMSEPTQVYEPGEFTAYSNWGAALVALIVQEVSGEDYITYVHKNILEPLGMEHTSIGTDFSDNQWVKKQRESLNCYMIMEDIYEDYGTAISYILLYPVGSAAGTLEDLATFAKTFVPKEGESSPLFKSKKTLELMKEATSFYGDSNVPRDCHGLLTLQYTKNIMGHAGNTNGCSSMLMFEPESGLGVVIMTNELGETAFNYGILSLIYGDYQDNEIIKNAKFEPSKDMSGVYTSKRTMEKGYQSIYKYLGSLMPLSKTEDKNIFKLSIGQGTLTKVAEHQYILDNGNGSRTLMYEREGANGETILENFSMDVERENTIKFTLKIASIILFVLSILMCIVILLSKIIIYIGRKILGKEKIEDNRVLGRMNKIAISINILIGVIFYNIIVIPLDGVSVNQSLVMTQCIIIGILSLVSLINMVVLLKNYRNYSLTKMNKLKFVIIAIASFYISAFVLYWQLFDFWS